jgi:predicted RND superfamily exporter protein
MVSNSLIKFRFLLFGLLLLSTLVSISALFKLEVNQELDDYYPINNPDLKLHKHVTGQLDDQDDLVVVALVNDGNAFNPAFLEKVKDFTESCQEIAHVKDVYSLTNFKDYIFTDFGPISYSYIEQSVNGDFKVDTNRILNDPRTKDRYISRDQRSQLVTIMLDTNRTPDIDNEIITNLENQLNDVKLFNYVLGGRPYYEVVYNRAIGHELLRAVLLCIGFIVFILFVIYRSIQAIVLPLSVFVLSLINIMGLMVLFGQKVDGMTTLLPSIILVVSVSDVVHILSKYEFYIKLGQSRKEAFENAINSAGLATFLTSFTTAIGFFVLAFSPIPILTRFSLEIGAGVLLAYIIAVVTLSMLVLLVKPEKLFISPILSTWWDKTYKVIKTVLARNGHFIETTAVIMGISGIAASFFIDTNHTLNSAVSSKDLRSSVSFFDSQTGGARYFQLALIPQKNRKLTDLEVLEEIDKIETYLSSIPEISNVISPLTYFKSLNMSMNGGRLTEYKLPTTQDKIDEQTKAVKKGKVSFTSSVFNKSKTIGRISGSVPDLGRKNIKIINSKTTVWIAENVNKDLLKAQITGPSHMVDVVQETSIRNMFFGLVATFIAIAIIVAIVMKNFFYSLVSLVVNILPLLVTALAMAIFDIELRFATSIIFTIGYVIAIDDTIHTLINFDSERKKIDSGEVAVYSTLNHTGRAIVITTIILMSGFSVLMFSSFRDVQDIGSLTTILLLFALLTDLFLCPKLILNKLRLNP